MKTPIALIIFNRPDYTARVFEEIRQAKPPQLLVIADGPRPDHVEDIQKCAATREIIDRVDWECEVFKNFSDTNLGCGVRPATGISWVFENVETAIILEDDCIPHPSFFAFCDELLERYRHDTRVMHISGNNYWSNKHPRAENYTFSRYPMSWGWATWRRAWQHYDFDMKLWPEIAQKKILLDLLNDRHTAQTWTRIFQDVVDMDLGCWDFQWILTCWLQNGLAILPNINLVSNIGFGDDATHTFSADSTSVDGFQLSVPADKMTFPLKNPQMMIPDSHIDRFIQDAIYDYFPKLPKKIRLKLNRIIFNKSGFRLNTSLDSTQ